MSTKHTPGPWRVANHRVKVQSKLARDEYAAHVERCRAAATWEELEALLTAWSDPKAVRAREARYRAAKRAQVDAALRGVA